MTNPSDDLAAELRSRHLARDAASEETYKGFLIRPLSGAGWDVSKNGEHYSTYGSLASAKQGIDRSEQALREQEMKRKFTRGRSAG